MLANTVTLRAAITACTTIAAMLATPATAEASTAPDADAPTTSPTLRWSAPMGCPTDADVRTRVEALIGRSLRDHDEAAQIDAEITASTPPQLRLVVRSDSGTRERTIAAKDCTELAEIAAVVIAVTLDPSASLRAPEPAPPPDEPSPPAPPPAPRPVDPSPRVGGLVRLGGGVGLGPLPAVAGVLDGEIGARWKHARLVVGVEHQFPTEVTLRPSGAGARVALTAVRVVGCYVGTVGKRVEFPICAGASAGVMSARGFGVPRRERKRLPWAGAHLETGVTVIALRWLAFGLIGRVGVPFVRPGFALDDFGVVHRAAPAAFTGLATIELRFP